MLRKRPIVRALAITVLALACAEFALRLGTDPPVPWDPAPFRWRDDSFGLQDRETDCRLVLPSSHPVVYSRIPRDRFLGRRKEPGTFRVLICGESAIYGSGLPVTASPWWRLERLLQTVVPEGKWEVVSLAQEGCSCSLQLVSLKYALENLSPDLVIIQAGNNEFLSVLAYRSVYPDYDARAESAKRLYRRSRLYGLLYRLVTKWKPSPSITVFVKGDAISASVIGPGDVELAEEAYERIMEELCRACQRKSVPVVLCTVPVNRRCPPNEPPPPGVEREIGSVSGLRQEGRPEEALARLRSLADRLPRSHAHHEAGMCLLALGRMEEACAQFDQALLTDRHPRRAMPWSSDVLNRVGQRLQVPVCDVAAGLDGMSQRGIAGDEEFLDFCHFSSLGSRRVARLIADFLIARRLIPLAGDAHLPTESRDVRSLSLEEWAGPRDFFASMDAVPGSSLATLRDLYLYKGKPQAVATWLPALDVEACSDVDQLRLYGHLLCMDDRYDEALACYARARQLPGGGSADLCFEAGLAAMLASRLDDAVAMFERVMLVRADDAFVARKLRVLRMVTERSTGLPPLPRVVPQPAAPPPPRDPASHGG